MAKPARITASRKVSQPVLVVPVVAIALGLLERIVDGDRKGRMRLLGKAVHRLGHAIEEESLCFFLTAVAIGCSNQFLGLGHSKSAKDQGKETSVSGEARHRKNLKIRIADIVVVRRISRNNFIEANRLGRRV